MKALMEALGPENQREPIRGREAEMAKNNAQGLTFVLTDWARLDRFLILGTEGGTYYTSERTITRANAAVVSRCIKEDGVRTVHTIVAVSHGGRAPKNDQAIFALALCVAEGDPETKRLALAELPKVCRIGTHILQFCAFLKAVKGSLSGRSVKRAISDWYGTRDSEFAYEWSALQAVKYRNRHGWTHRDVLRMVRPRGKSRDPVLDNLFSWITHPDKYHVSDDTSVTLKAFLELQGAANETEAANLIRHNQMLTHEMVPTEIKGPLAWQALLDRGMPMTALIRNLATLTRHDMLAPLSDNELTVRRQLLSRTNLHKARVHPMNLLVALLTYEAGTSLRGKAEWEPNRSIVDALEEAFYLAMPEPYDEIDKNVYVAVDVSGSMHWTNLMNVPNFTPAHASAALSVCYAQMFNRAFINGFASTREPGTFTSSRSRISSSMIDLGITKRSSLKEAVSAVSNMPMGGTDCALPMVHAREAGMKVDTFIVLTDNETWAGDLHPSVALKEYRKASGIDAKLIVCAMTATEFSIADPADPGMLDVVGFDTSVPKLMEDFAK